MDYRKIYNRLCERGQTRIQDDDEYYERHHIIPKCLDGTDDDSNLTYLTYREHVLCHWILHRLYPNNSKLGLAFHAMTTLGRWKTRKLNYKPSLRQLEEAKKSYIQYRTGRKHTKETRDKISESLKGIDSWNKGKTGIYSDETIEKLRDAKLGWNRSDEDKKKISEGKKQWWIENDIDRESWNDKQKQEYRKKRKLVNSDEWDDIRERVYTKYKSGESITTISKEEPISRQGIYGWINKYGWSR